MKVNKPMFTWLCQARRSIVLALGGGLLAAAAQAQSLAHCRTLADAAARLACYDALPGPAVATPARAVVAKDAAPVSGREATGSGAPAARAAAGAASVAAAADFGLEKPAARAEELHSSIPGSFTGWGPRSRVRLANGQLWEIADGSRVVYALNSPGVRVVRGMLGAFYMEVDGVNQRPRVRRIE